MLPHLTSDYIDSGLLSLKDPERFCDFPGGFILWELHDIRKFPIGELRNGWLKAHGETPFRLYVTDYDDWNAEKLFASKTEALKVIAKLNVKEIYSDKDIYSLGILPT